MKYLLLLLSLCVCAWGLEPTEVAVVYNAQSELSKAAAMRYCQVRRIPRDQLLPLHGVARGNISREDFDTSIVKSLLVEGHKRGLMWPAGPRNGRKLMRAMVLMPDIPLKVKETMINGKPAGTGLRRTEAAVDAELMLLGAEFPTTGMGNNPFYKKEFPKKDTKPSVMMVCRIDGPDEACIYRMINDPVKVEKKGLWGWVVTDNGGPYKAGDALITEVARLANLHCQPLFNETSRSTLPDGFPLMQQVIAYFGWYTRSANGPFHPNAPADFKLAKGAVACHLHSFSATDIYNGVSWVSALLKRGACVTAGNVAEPYLNACLNYGVFYEQLLAGNQVAEAALVASPTVSWQCIVLGDPLYRPFPNKPKLDREDPYVIWRNVRRRAGDSFRALQLAVEQKMSSHNGALYAEMFAWYCTEEKQYETAREYFALAAKRHYKKTDKIRAQLLHASTTAAAGNRERAWKLYEKMMLDYATSPYLKAIKATAEPCRPKPASTTADKKGSAKGEPVAK